LLSETFLYIHVMPRFDASNHLTQHIKQLMSARTVSQADLIDILRRCRLMLDQNKTKSSYPVLSLYCNWLQHDEIDRHPTGFEILEKIDRLSITHGSD